MDVALAVVLMVLSLPVCLLSAVMLKATGDSEVFYTQYRIGLRNRPFKIIKFTTMRRGSEQLGSVTIRGDQRVTSLGRILRLTKINELPQLVNVLIGDMSVVGPRPLVEEGFRMYPDSVQAKIFAHARPGLTGLGSLIFRDEEGYLAASAKNTYRAYQEDIMPLKGALEVWYVEHRSVNLDLKIIVLTALRVLFPRNTLHRRLLRELPERWRNLE